jgi:large subunit ribosomal protein L25
LETKMEIVALKVQDRKELGTRPNRRLRATGVVPAVIYGKKNPTKSLMVNVKELMGVLKKGVRLIDLNTPEGMLKAFIREVQYDAFGDKIVHVDFNVIALDEKLTLDIPVELKGKAKGSVAGGVVSLELKHLKVQCLPTDIPQCIEIDITEMDIDTFLLVKDVKVPTGVAVLDPQGLTVVSIRTPLEIVETVAAVPGPAEPEVITAKKEEEEGDAAAPAKKEKDEKPEKKEKEKAK